LAVVDWNPGWLDPSALPGIQHVVRYFASQLGVLLLPSQAEQEEAAMYALDLEKHLTRTFTIDLSSWFVGVKVEFLVTVASHESRDQSGGVSGGSLK
jgi:hypothetical protein